MNITSFILITGCVALYTGAVTHMFVTHMQTKRLRREAAADLEEVRLHQRYVAEALALWNYGAHDEAMEILRGEGFGVVQETLDAE